MAGRNEEDVQLLYHDPHALLTKHQPTIAIIINKFIASGFFAPGEREDLVQTINEKLLRDKLRNMQAQYNYSAYVATYFSKIVYNLCIELHRATKRERVFDRSKELEEVEAGYEDERGLGAAVIAQETLRFETILKLFGKARAKLELCLRLLFRMEITAAEVREYYPACSSQDLHTLLTAFGGDFESMTDKEIYALVTPICNRREGKNNSPDALRKWSNMKVEEILALLNSRASRSSYDFETLKILMQKFEETRKAAAESLK